MKLLLIDDDPRVRKTLERILKEEYIVESVGTAHEAEKKIYDSQYDLILLDLILPDMDGEDLCSMIKAYNPNIPIIVLSGKCTVSDKDVAFKKGADDYITKPINPAELKIRIRSQIKRGTNGIKPELENLKIRGLEFNRMKLIVRYKKERIYLRKKELMMLEFLMLNAGRVITRGEILEKVWDSEVSPFTNTVDVHMKRLRDKIEKPYGENYIETVHGIGYLVE